MHDLDECCLTLFLWIYNSGLRWTGWILVAEHKAWLPVCVQIELGFSVPYVADQLGLLGGALD